LSRRFPAPAKCLPLGQRRRGRTNNIKTISALSRAFALWCPELSLCVAMRALSSRSCKNAAAPLGNLRFPRKTPGTFSDQPRCDACATADRKSCGHRTGPSSATLRARSGRILRSASGGTTMRNRTMRNSLWAAVSVLTIALVPAGGAQADTVGAAAGAGTGLLVAGPVGAVVGGVVGAVWGRPFWGPPHSPHACWIDNHFYRHCRWSHGHWYR
jgi:hypothetical protein